MSKTVDVEAGRVRNSIVVGVGGAEKGGIQACSMLPVDNYITLIWRHLVGET